MDWMDRLNWIEWKSELCKLTLTVNCLFVFIIFCFYRFLDCYHAVLMYWTIWCEPISNIRFLWNVPLLLHISTALVYSLSFIGAQAIFNTSVQLQAYIYLYEREREILQERFILITWVFSDTSARTFIEKSSCLIALKNLSGKMSSPSPSLKAAFNTPRHLFNNSSLIISWSWNVFLLMFFYLKA